MTARSLRLRLILAGIAAILLALTLAGFGISLLFERHVSRSLSDDLGVDLKQMLASVDVDANDHLILPRQPGDPRFATPLSGLYWQISDSHGEMLRSRSLWDATLPLADDPIQPGEVHVHRLPGPGGTRLLVAERLATLSSGARPRIIRLAVGADLARVAAAGRAFDRDMALALAFLALVLGAATSAQVLLGLRPLKRLRHAVAEIRAGNTSRLSADAPLEVRPLVEEVNALLDARQREIEASRGRAADLAHGLKTPLAALMSDARRLRQQGQDRIATDIEEVAQSMTRHVDRELARARLGGSRRAGDVITTELAPLVRGLFATIARTPVGAAITFETDGIEAAWLPFERADLAEVLGNLIDNAARHAHSRVRLVFMSGCLSVEDDGPGLDADERMAVLQRGVRLDERGSAGLGLALVQEVLDAYGWRLQLDASPLGGLSALIEAVQESQPSSS